MRFLDALDAAAPFVVDRLPAARHPLRIAVVTETYPPEVNGVAMSLARVVDGMHRRHHDVQLVRPRQHRLDAAAPRERLDEVLTGSWPIPAYPHLRMGTPSTGALVRLWERRRPDVIHVATEGPLGWSALQAARRLRLPVTSDFRTNFHAYGRHYRLGWLARPIMAYLRRFHNRADATMVPTEALRAQLAAGGFERLSVVARGVDTRLFHPDRRSAALRATWGADERTLVLGYVGRLAAEKNLDAVLDAHAALREVLGTVRMVVVGDGPLRAELARRCPDAVFAGQRKGEDLAAHYASLDAFLFPSLTETFGNVTLEAMASGLAVVAHDTAAAGQLIHSGVNGLLAEGSAVTSFVRAALVLAAAPDRVALFGARARASVESLDWDEVVGRFEAVLAAIVERQRPSSTVSTVAWQESVRRHA